MTESRRGVLATLLIIALILCALLPSGTAAAIKVVSVATNETVDIPSGGNVVLLHFRAEDQALVNYAFNVTQGGAVDILVLDRVQHELYRIGANVTCLQGSTLNRSQGLAVVTGLTNGSEYYLVADNTGVPAGGASPTGKVVLNFGLATDNLTVIPEENSLLPWLILVLVIFVVVVVVLARSGVAAKEPGGHIRGLGRKHCPKCGQVVASYVHKCPKCGNEW